MLVQIIKKTKERTNLNLKDEKGLASIQSGRKVFKGSSVQNSIFYKRCFPYKNLNKVLKFNRGMVNP